MTNTTTTAIAELTTSAATGAKPASGKTQILLYTDGACLNNPGWGGWGFVALLVDEAGAILSTEERYGSARTETTNNRTEMAAAFKGLDFAKEQIAVGAWPTSPVTLISDSQYVIKGFTEWVPSWEARGWRKSNGRAPDNGDLWERLKAAAVGLTVEWRWVKGHSGDPWNEKADALANQGAEDAKARG